MERLEYEKNVSTKQHSEEKDPWLPGPHAHKIGPEGNQPQKVKGEEETHRLSKWNGLVRVRKSEILPGNRMVASAPSLQERFFLKKHERLRHRKDFELAFHSGSRRHTKNFTIILRPNGLQFSRLGVTVGKKVGNAVKRNRVKRYLREFFRLHKHKLPPSQDVVIVARGDAATLAYQDVREELVAVLIGNNCL